MQIIVKNYAHVNKSFSGWDTPHGKIIKSKEHYERTMKEQGMVSFEEAQELSERGRQGKMRDYKVSDESLAIIQAAKQSMDKKGNVKLGTRAIDALIKRKAIGKKVPDYMQLPAAYGKGGFVK